MVTGRGLSPSRNVMHFPYHEGTPPEQAASKERFRRITSPDQRENGNPMPARVTKFVTAGRKLSDRPSSAGLFVRVGRR